MKFEYLIKISLFSVTYRKPPICTVIKKIKSNLGIIDLEIKVEFILFDVDFVSTPG